MNPHVASANQEPHSNIPAHPPQQPKLLHRLRTAMQQDRFDPATIGRFVEWNRRLILHHGLRHPRALTDDEIAAFVAQVSSRDTDRREAARVIRFLYGKVLGVTCRSPWVRVR